MSNDEAKQEPTTAAGPSPDAPTAAETKLRQAVKPPVAPGGAVPKKAAEDDPRAWGDRESETDHDAWLREQKPPHWG
jgi:hypothetical protein